MRRAAAPRRSLLLLLGVLAAACSPDAAADGGCPPRRGRFGSLRDFVLFDLAVDGRSVVLFVDRFEATCSDWREFAASPAGRGLGAPLAADGDDARPVAGVDLEQARAFARWRFGRLPRSDEWLLVATNNRHNAFPWGDRVDPTRANTSELGLGETVPVGTFESGRRTGSNHPYDLVGNVSEWTESVPADWSQDELDPAGSPGRNHERALATPALAVWQGAGGLLPLSFAIAAGGRYVPHEVVGADFLSQMFERIQVVPAGDRRPRTGLRVVASPRDLLVDLLASDAVPTPADLEQVRRFLRRDRHRAALAAVWTTAWNSAVHRGAPLRGALVDLLRTELGAAKG